jgi:hypothetical protein
MKNNNASFMEKNETYDILFFDIPYVNLRRFGNELSHYVKQENPNISTVGVFCNRIPKKYGVTSFNKIFLRKDIKDIDVFLLKHKIKILVLTNPRIPDQEMMLHAKKNGIKVVMLQEGIIFNGTNINDINLRNIFSIFGKLKKSMGYLRIMRKMCKYDKKPFLPLIAAIFKKKNNVTLIVANYFSYKLKADFMYIMGNYWRDYYVSEIGHEERELVLIGDHDLDDFSEPKETEDAICYIANVLVEDGTIRKTAFLRFIKMFSECVDKNRKIYIKLHPRSDIKLYQAFENHNVVYLRKEALPNVKIYFGHRSTLIGRALYISDHLILWRFKSEKVCFYEPFASKVCVDRSDLVQALDETSAAKLTNEKRNRVEDYYWWNKNGALNSCANHILQYLNEVIL